LRRRPGTSRVRGEVREHTIRYGHDASLVESAEERTSVNARSIEHLMKHVRLRDFLSKISSRLADESLQAVSLSIYRRCRCSSSEHARTRKGGFRVNESFLSISLLIRLQLPAVQEETPTEAHESPDPSSPMVQDQRTKRARTVSSAGRAKVRKYAPIASLL
jgi:hypothetical protein